MTAEGTDDRKPELVAGVMIADPLIALPTGSALSIQALPFPSTIAPDTWAYYRGALLQMHWRTNEEEVVDGSAAMVAPGVAVAARHVIEDQNRLQRVMAGEMIVWLSAICAEGLELWKVRHITVQNGTDLCLLSLERSSELPADGILRQVALSRRIPEVGEQLMVAGYRAPQPVMLPAEPDSFIDGQVMISVGIVTAVYSNGRDRAMLPWPCVELNVGSSGGMSGGPTFNRDGRMIGVLCSSIGEGQDGTSYIALIDPILGVPFTHCWPPGIYPDRISLLGMSQACAIEACD